jgi:hypothetical protein
VSRKRKAKPRKRRKGKVIGSPADGMGTRYRLAELGPRKVKLAK